MKAMSPALLTAFSTASSSGTLAVTLERAEDGAGISNRITSFVLPLGATVNMDGTALYECVTVLFIAQLHAATHAGVDPLTFGQQVLVVFLALLVSIGAAGIPHAGLVMMVIILKAVEPAARIHRPDLGRGPGARHGAHGDQRLERRRRRGGGGPHRGGDRRVGAVRPRRLTGSPPHSPVPSPTLKGGRGAPPPTRGISFTAPIALVS